MPYVITGTDPRTRESFYLRLKPGGGFDRVAEPCQAELWEDYRALLAWLDGLDDATLAKLESRNPRPVEVEGPTLAPSVTQAELQASMERPNIQKSARLPKRQRKAS